MISTDKGHSFVHINARSIFRKILQIEYLYSQYDFLFCTETWLDNRYSNTMINITDMRIFRCDRVMGNCD